MMDAFLQPNEQCRWAQLSAATRTVITRARLAILHTLEQKKDYVGLCARAGSDFYVGSGAGRLASKALPAGCTVQAEERSSWQGMRFAVVTRRSEHARTCPDPARPDHVTGALVGHGRCSSGLPAMSVRSKPSF